MSADYARTGFARRIASLIYDGLVVIAFAMLTTVVYLLVVQGAISLGWLSLGEAEDVAALIQQNTVLYVLRDVLLVLVSLSFFGYFWSKSGQTIGMRAWRMQVRRLDGCLPGFWQSAWRSLCALLGLGNILVLVDIKNKRALQDYLSGCEVVTLSKEDNKKIYQALD
ncbi:RDD family protein [Pseudoalteromonas ruthenica]|uniref:RDD family protein n=1 Tax=Pseudoalteromonas ruthenica TaxID=151081 RepID=UPI00241E4E33|nr:RDD family protein [Pseudoalteromonas ruthenica]|tara:strand:- start:76359 stop:76859 length:501 start_codon:yes stop_codon:yes gene_type:complete